MSVDPIMPEVPEMKNEVVNFNEVLDDSHTPHTDYIEKCVNILGTNKFILLLTILFIAWLGGNVAMMLVFHWAFDPAPFLLISTVINLYGAFNNSFILKASKAQQERDELKHDHEFEVNKKILAMNEQILKAVTYSHNSLRKTIINTSDVDAKIADTQVKDTNA
jgi:uncharacterized membrane protein